MNEGTGSGSASGRHISHAVVSLIETGLGPDKCSIYIGGTMAARDIGLIRERDITTVVNCAVNLDVNYVTDPVEPIDGDKRAYGLGPVRVFKLGLVDGPGNTDDMMLASYLLLDGAIRQVIPEKKSYPLRRKGNVLVHCRGGRSRSTALVALYLHLNRPGKFPTLNSALAFVREKRGLHPDEWSTAPKPMLVEAAQMAAEKLKKIS